MKTHLEYRIDSILDSVPAKAACTARLKRFAAGALTAGTLAIALMGACSSAMAQSAVDDSLYKTFGEKPGLVSLVDDLVVRLLADPRMNPFFKDADIPDLKMKLVAQFCDVSGGPCKTVNTDMKKTHAGHDINANNFNALVEVLQQSMDAHDIPFSAQNKLLARLAPMHRDIVNIHGDAPPPPMSPLPMPTAPSAKIATVSAAR